MVSILIISSINSILLISSLVQKIHAMLCARMGDCNTLFNLFFQCRHYKELC